jgi:hypothetical protein
MVSRSIDVDAIGLVQCGRTTVSRQGVLHRCGEIAVGRNRSRSKGNKMRMLEKFLMKKRRTNLKMAFSVRMSPSTFV